MLLHQSWGEIGGATYLKLEPNVRETLAEVVAVHSYVVQLAVQALALPRIGHPGDLQGDFMGTTLGDGEDRPPARCENATDLPHCLAVPWHMLKHITGDH